MIFSLAINRVRSGDTLITEYVKLEDGSFHIEKQKVDQFTFTGDLYIVKLEDGSIITKNGIDHVLVEVM